jgi:hypothetical protein
MPNPSVFLEGAKNMKTNHKRLLSITLALVITFALVGCMPTVVDTTSGTALAIGTAETISGLKAVVSGQPGTLVYQLETTIMMAWPSGSNYAFAVMTTNGQPITGMTMINGQAVSTYKLCDLIKTMEANGWKAIDPKLIPTVLVQALTAYTVEAVVAGMQTLPTIIVLPSIWLEPLPVEPTEEVL